MAISRMEPQCLTPPVSPLSVFPLRLRAAVSFIWGYFWFNYGERKRGEGEPHHPARVDTAREGSAGAAGAPLRGSPGNGGARPGSGRAAEPRPAPPGRPRESPRSPCAEFGMSSQGRPPSPPPPPGSRPRRCRGIPYSAGTSGLIWLIKDYLLILQLPLIPARFRTPSVINSRLAKLRAALLKHYQN